MSRPRLGPFVFIAALLALLLSFSPSLRAQTQSTPPASSSSSAASAPSAGTPSYPTHVVTVTFDYDFGKTPACSAKVTKQCVQQFIAYDISASAKHPTMLFPIPLPAKPVGQVKGITKASPPLEFEPGKHLISVSAMAPDGKHSKRSLCTTWIAIPPAP